MAEQTVMFTPGSGGLETLHVRRTDPETSKAAARELSSRRMGFERAMFTMILRTHGPKTCNEAAHLTDNHGYWAFRFNSRVHAWHVAGHIELTGEEREGSRVWRIAEETT